VKSYYLLGLLNVLMMLMVALLYAHWAVSTGELSGTQKICVGLAVYFTAVLTISLITKTS
jgi:hypothetical protein